MSSNIIAINPSLLAAHYIIDVLPINPKYVDEKQLAEDIKKMIEGVLDELSMEYWYLNGNFINNEAYISDYLDKYKNMEVLYSVIDKNVDTEIEDKIVDALIKFYQDIQPIVAEIQMENRKTSVNEHLYPQLANIAAQY